jgi:hypothetical protein
MTPKSRQEIPTDERRREIWRRLAQKGSLTREEMKDNSLWTSSTQWGQDFEALSSPLELLREFLQMYLGPKPLGIEIDEERKSASLRWKPFGKVFQRKLEAKLAIARLLLNGMVDGREPILSRQSHVLLGPPGSTSVFAVAWQLAKQAVDKLCGSGAGFDPPFTSEWHTDAWAIADILASVSVADSTAPKVYLGGCPLSQQGHDLDVWSPLELLVCPNASHPRDCPVLVLGCHRIDRQGHIYTSKQIHADYINQLVAEVTSKQNSKVILAVTADKLVKSTDGRPIEVDTKNSEFLIVTDRKPGFLPRGFSNIYWPDRTRARDLSSDVVAESAARWSRPRRPHQPR